MKTTRQHIRINDIFLGPVERPILNWLAARMPAWVTPDICTAVGVGGALVTAVSYGLSNLNPNFLWLASLGLGIHWLGDSLDGTLARYRHTERPLYGYYIDHTTDIVCIAIIFLGLGASPYVSFDIACLALIAFVLMCALAYLRTYVAGEFKISYGKLGPTESRAVTVLLNTAMYFFGVQKFTVLQAAFTTYDIFVAAIGLILIVLFFNTAIQEAIRLAAQGE